jgi:hypothetical protein
MSVTPGLTPETLSFSEVLKWTGQEMKDQMRRSDEMRHAVLTVVKSQSLADIEAAQRQIEANSAVQPEPEIVPDPVVTLPDEAEQQRIAAVQAEAQAAAAKEAEREAALKVENEQLALAGISATRDQYGNIAKLVQDYQSVDEHGNPIGRPTHLEARSWVELSIKQKEAHTQAVRWGHRLKQQKISFKDQQPVSPQNLSDAELLESMKDLKSDDPQKQLAAIRKVQKAEKDKLDAEAAETARQAAVSRRFLDNHKEDFYNCKANIELVKDYFVENPELTWTYDNLEICFLAIESKLAPVPREPVAPTPPANPVVTAPVVPVTPVAAVTVTPTAVPAVQPVATVPAQAAAPVNPATAIPRPGVNGGLVPGESSATRPGPAKPKKLTSEEVKSWSPEQMKKHMRDPQMRPLIEEFVRERNQRAQR